ncbi:MAG: hypothetical protein NZV14_07990 [Bryobacteraceae bacterium]|nr:hypothetical protein [Bryobacteraceae bacterium]MDW8378087.1 hypothetical protein [Bryobacterales bacterium]
MALFTDRAVPSVQELLKYDANLLEIGSAYNLDSAEKLNIAREQVATEIEAFLRRERLGVSLGSVVVTEPLRRWVMERALALIYRDAYYGQLHERYRAKWLEYDKLARETKRFVYENGLGCVRNPIPRAMRPVVTVTTGLLPAGTYFVRMSWVGTGGQTGHASEVATVTLTAPGGLLISPASVPDGVSGWHVYAGELEDKVRKQNSGALGIPGSWQVEGPELGEGDPPSAGQDPDFFVTASNGLQRG